MPDERREDRILQVLPPLVKSDFLWHYTGDSSDVPIAARLLVEDGVVAHASAAPRWKLRDGGQHPPAVRHTRVVNATYTPAGILYPVDRDAPPDYEPSHQSPEWQTIQVLDIPERFRYCTVSPYVGDWIIAILLQVNAYNQTRAVFATASHSRDTLLTPVSGGTVVEPTPESESESKSESESESGED